jgi:hypothetical protein
MPLITIIDPPSSTQFLSAPSTSSARARPRSDIANFLQIPRRRAHRCCWIYLRSLFRDDRGQAARYSHRHTCYLYARLRYDHDEEGGDWEQRTSSTGPAVYFYIQTPVIARVGDAVWIVLKKERKKYRKRESITPVVERRPKTNIAPTSPAGFDPRKPAFTINSRRAHAALPLSDNAPCQFIIHFHLRLLFHIVRFIVWIVWMSQNFTTQLLSNVRVLLFMRLLL